MYGRKADTFLGCGCDGIEGKTNGRENTEEENGHTTFNGDHQPTTITRATSNIGKMALTTKIIGHIHARGCLFVPPFILFPLSFLLSSRLTPRFRLFILDPTDDDELF